MLANTGAANFIRILVNIVALSWFSSTTKMCVDMYADMCVDMYVDMCRHVYKVTPGMCHATVDNHFLVLVVTFTRFASTTKMLQHGTSSAVLGNAGASNFTPAARCGLRDAWARVMA